MAYRQPSSSICLLKGCPCDSEYINTVYYETRQKQYNDTNPSNPGLLTLCPHVWFNNQSYQRKNKNTLRIDVNQANFENYLEYNYLIFSNAPIALNDNSTITKATGLFYAFLDTVDYINDNCIEVTYTIDFIQTYMFDYRLGSCFIDREHSYSDNLYEHLEAESFEPSDYNYDEADVIDYSSELSVRVRYVVNEQYIEGWYYEYNTATEKRLEYKVNSVEFAIDRVNYINNLPSYTRTVTIPLFTGYANAAVDNRINVAGILGALRSMSGQTDIVDITILPTALCPHNTVIDAGGHTVYLETQYPDAMGASARITHTINQQTTFTDPKGNTYTPKNKKLFSSPYNTLYITTEQGENAELLWENFSGSSASFTEVGATYGAPEIKFIPQNYNGKTYATENSVSLQNFPSTVWNVDSAQVYWEQNKAQITTNHLINIIAMVGLAAGGIALDVATGGAASAATGAIGAITGDKLLLGALAMGAKEVKDASSDIAKAIDMKAVPDKMLGTLSNSQIPIVNNYFGFKIYYKSIKPYEAKMIDDYFSLFGYAVKKLKVPNLYTANGTNRRAWYYLKNVYTRIEPHISSATTQIDSFVNEEVDSTLQKIYNKGITFWFNSSDVGDYSLNNSPII